MSIGSNKVITRSISIWFVAITLLAYGSYNIWLIVVSSNNWFSIWVIACFAAASGLILSKSWSQYLVYILSIATAGGWLYVVIYMAIDDWPYSGAKDTFIALLPGILLVSVCIVFCALVFNFFKRVKIKS